MTDRREKGVDIGRKQTHAHSCDTEHKKAKLPSAHAQGGHQQRGHHTEEDIFNVGHSSTAFLTASIKSRRVVAFPEEGMEALHEIEVENFPAIVAIAHGESIYDK